ncbi:hypothetical protein ACIO02_34110 [Streptomyces sp. NPDC087568]|uniref:hypothetical protein n=1 Tax=Streptomyces sp. NPDC087568 TaxID=3365799 RepID=UPI0037FC5B0C
MTFAPTPYGHEQFGPRLTFTAGTDPTGSALLIDVDRHAPTNPRDRALCRALLTHALHLLDETEPQETVAAAQPPADRAAVLREAYEIAYAEGMRLNALEAEIGVGPYRGALAVAHLLRKAISDVQKMRGMAKVISDMQKARGMADEGELLRNQVEAETRMADRDREQLARAERAAEQAKREYDQRAAELEEAQAALERVRAVVASWKQMPAGRYVYIDEAARTVSDALNKASCTTQCDGVTGIRGLLEHVGIDTRGRDIAIAGRVIDASDAGHPADRPAEARSWPGELCAHCPPGTRAANLEQHMVDVHGARPAEQPTLRELLTEAIDHTLMPVVANRAVRRETARQAAAEVLAVILPTTRLLAGLRESAEADVSRVIALYERWKAAGQPPLGMSRWWDARLAELHDAISPPQPPTAPTSTGTGTTEK